MILRKPYAFLIKHFRKINLLMLALAVYVFIVTMDLYAFVKTYLDTGIYNEIDVISNYINGYFIIANIFLIILGMILVYLLRHKQKPIKVYLFVIVEYIALFILSLFITKYFNDYTFEGFNKQSALAVRDLVFILSLPQYLILLLLSIRTIGLDLNSFGFGKEIDANEEDREEIEVSATFNKDRIIRRIKKFIRETLYFVKEKKVYIIIISLIIILISGMSLYNSFYVKNRIYGMKSKINSNDMTITINNAYITNRNFRGDIIDERASFVILDVNVDNNLNMYRKLDLNTFMLYSGENFYTPATRFNDFFSDMGTLYLNQQMEPNSKKNNFFLIYQIENPDKDDNYILRYQEKNNGGNLIRVKLKIRDISEFITKGTANVNQLLKIPINPENTYDLKIKEYKIGEAFNYTYLSCDSNNNCPVYEQTINAYSGRNILFMQFEITNKPRNEIIDFIKKYGRIRYIVGDKSYTEKIRDSFTGNYYGNFLYYSVDQNIKNASTIELILTIRSYQYIYKLK